MYLKTNEFIGLIKKKRFVYQFFAIFQKKMLVHEVAILENYFHQLHEREHVDPIDMQNTQIYYEIVLESTRMKQ